MLFELLLFKRLSRGTTLVMSQPNHIVPGDISWWMLPNHLGPAPSS